MLYSSPAAGIGKGERSDPNQLMPVWTPAPGAYNTRQEATANTAPKFKQVTALYKMNMQVWKCQEI